MPNKKPTESIEYYAVTIDSIEAVTGIDFFSQLPDSIENKIEQSFTLSDWPISAPKIYKHQNKSGSSVQCKGTTKKGKRCKSKTRDSSGFCRWHK